LKEWLQNINPWHDQEIILLHTYCHIYSAVPKYTLQHLKLRETTYMAGKWCRKSIYFRLTYSLIKVVGETSLLVDSSFSELINPLFLNMMQPPCKWITPEQPGSLIHVTPVWQQATTYSQHLMYTVSYYLQQLMTFYS